MYSFTANIYKEGMNYLVEVPAEFSVQLKISGNIPVKGYANGVPFKGTCVPRKGNHLALFLNSEIRNKIYKTEHDEVTLQIEYDSESRDLPVPEDLDMVLSEENGLSEYFLQMTTSHRKELIRYVLAAKKPETRLKYIRRVVDLVRDHRSKKKR